MRYVSSFTRKQRRYQASRSRKRWNCVPNGNTVYLSWFTRIYYLQNVHKEEINKLQLLTSFQNLLGLKSTQSQV